MGYNSHFFNNDSCVLWIKPNKSYAFGNERFKFFRRGVSDSLLLNPKRNLYTVRCMKQMAFLSHTPTYVIFKSGNYTASLHLEDCKSKNRISIKCTFSLLIKGLRSLFPIFAVKYQIILYEVCYPYVF